MKFRLFGIMQLGLWIRTEPQIMPSGLLTVFLTRVTSLPKLGNLFQVFPDSQLMLMSIHHPEILYLWILMLLNEKPAVLFLAIAAEKLDIKSRTVISILMSEPVQLMNCRVS